MKKDFIASYWLNMRVGMSIGEVEDSIALNTKYSEGMIMEGVKKFDLKTVDMAIESLKLNIDRYEKGETPWQSIEAYSRKKKERKKILNSLNKRYQKIVLFRGMKVENKGFESLMWKMENEEKAIRKEKK
jgi:hypothetical protein